MKFKKLDPSVVSIFLIFLLPLFLIPVDIALVFILYGSYLALIAIIGLPYLITWLWNKYIAKE
jgi:hypothetical protein